MKTCFIKLNEPWRADPYSDPPLGLLSVMAVAKDTSFKGKKLDVILFDMAHETKMPDADIYAFSACTLDYIRLLEVTNEIKKISSSKIIAGGPHFDSFSSAEWEKEINNLPIDIVCRGEGEYTFGKAIKFLETERKKGVIEQEGQLLDLDLLPLPAREFLRKDLYFTPGKVFEGNTFKKGNSTTMMTSRGCPYNCSFCASPILHHRKVRYRGIENVKKELEVLIQDYGVSEIRFQDDCFTLNPGRFNSLVNLLSQLNISYRCSMRVDQVDDKTLDMLWKSGCREIGFGIESAEDHILKLLDKKTSVYQNKEAIKKAKLKGFRTRAFIMTGLPGETRDSASKMVDFLEEANPDVVTLTSFMPLPGSDIYSNPEKYGLEIKDKDWGKYDIALKHESKTPFVHRLSTVSIEEMEANREILKEYIFNKGISNVVSYNSGYKSDVLNKG